MDTNLQDQIDQYILDQMPEAERRTFEARVAEDPALADELALQRRAIKAIRIAQLQERLQAARHRHREQQAAPPVLRLRTRRILSYAAAILVLVSLVAIWKPWIRSQNQLYQQYYEADPGLPTVMGAKATTLAEAMVEYKQAHYTLAIPMFRELQSKGIAGDTATFFLAASLQADGDQAAALEEFRKVSAQQPGLRQRADWYEALALIQLERPTEARTLLSRILRDPDHYYFEEAEDLIKKL